MASIDDLEKQLKHLGVAASETVSTNLPIRSASGNIYTAVPSFSGQTIGRFRIKEDKSYSTDCTNYAKMIPKRSYPSLIDRDLSVGYKTAKFIDNYQRYHELKQEYFLKWLVENDYFGKVGTGKHVAPDFICFGGRITDPMMSPEMERFGDWALYATKFRGVIYLWDEKRDYNRVKDLSSYYGLYFEHLLTNTDPSASVPNEYDKIYVINEVAFGTHRLLLLNEIDAEDENGEAVELKVYKKCSPKGMKGKYLKYWAQSVVPGIKTLIIGKRDDVGRLRDITSIATGELAIKQRIDTKACLNFEDRLLKWMKDCFKNAKDGDVKKFTWVCGNDAATVSDVRKQNVPKYLLPTWFADKMEDTTKEAGGKTIGKKVEPASTPK